MPKFNHEDLEAVLNVIYRKGIITAVDAENDTADVDVPGGKSGSGVPIYYHCEPDSELRSNGAIEGGSAAFGVDDEVIVMCDTEGVPLRIIGFVDGIKACFGYMVVTIGTYCFVWDFKTDALAEDVHIDGDPETMAVFPCLYSTISEWIASKTLLSFDTLFSKETESTILTGSQVLTSGMIYDNSYECPNPNDGWHEDFSAYQQFDRHNSRTSIFGTADYWDFVDYRWNEVLSGDCGGGGIAYWNSGKDLDEKYSSASGFKLTALNGSDEEVNFYCVNSYTYNEDTWQETDWNDCTDYAGSKVYNQTITPYFAYFPSVSAKTRNYTSTLTGCDGAWTSVPDPISIPITIGYAAHYSEDFGVITQLFIYKDADGNYSAYGQADAGLDDVTVAPSSLTENSDLSSALKALAEAADSTALSTRFYK